LRRGFDIPIEERHPDEVLGAWGRIERQVVGGKLRKLSSGSRAYVRVGNPTSSARNPGFDVTPPDLVTGIITPLGIFKPRDLWKNRRRLGGPVIPNHFQNETNSLVFWAAGFVARSLQTAAGMRLACASPAAQNPARLSLILKAHWN